MVWLMDLFKWVSMGLGFFNAAWSCPSRSDTVLLVFVHVYRDLCASLANNFIMCSWVGISVYDGL